MSYSTQSDSSCHFEIFFFGQTMTCSRSKLFLNILGSHFLHFVNGITSKDQVLFLIVWAHKSVTGHLFCFFVLRSSVKFLVLWFGIRPSSRSGSFLFICSRCISCVFMRQSFRKRMSMQRSKEITKQFIINKKKKKKVWGGGRQMDIFKTLMPCCFLQINLAPVSWSSSGIYSLWSKQDLLPFLAYHNAI